MSKKTLMMIILIIGIFVSVVLTDFIFLGLIKLNLISKSLVKDKFFSKTIVVVIYAIWCLLWSAFLNKFYKDKDK